MYGLHLQGWKVRKETSMKLLARIENAAFWDMMLGSPRFLLDIISVR
jgi:hypothetical protein